MKTEWDYTELAEAYLKRPEYSREALKQLFEIAGLKAGDKVCDIGAGVAHLSIPLAEEGFVVDSVEPNDAMRALGTERTKSMKNVAWFEGTGEESGRESHVYDFVSFGSSFNVCDRAKAMEEVCRLLKSQKYFTCMWNHRDLDDPIQKNIESIIANHVEGYGYGTRREDQSEVIAQSGLFTDIQEVNGKVLHKQSIEDVVEAWRSHGTLHRQAKEKFGLIIEEIESYLKSLNVQEIDIPYTTRAWIARKKA